MKKKYIKIPKGLFKKLNFKIKLKKFGFLENQCECPMCQLIRLNEKENTSTT